MSSMDYQTLYASFLTKVKAYDLYKDSVSDEVRQNLLKGYLHSAFAQPQIRRLFSSLTFDDVLEIVTYEINEQTSNDDDALDNWFVSEVIGYGMALAWITPQINSLTNIAQMFSTSDAKFYSQASHVEELRNLRDDLEIAYRKLITDNSSINNRYLRGNSASANIRTVE